MNSTRSLNDVYQHSAKLVQESAELRARATRSISETAVVIGRSRELLSPQQVSASPADLLARRSALAESVWDDLYRRQAKVPPAEAEPSLERIADRSFSGEAVPLDGRHFVDCILDNCVLEYSGGPVIMEGTNFTGCRFRFGGEAAMTVSMLDCFGLFNKQDVEPPLSSSSRPSRVN